MASRQCRIHFLAQLGYNHTPLTKPCHSLLLCTFLLASAKFTFLKAFLYLLNPLFLLSPSHSIPNTLTTIHPLNQSTVIHPFHMKKPFQRTFIYSLIYCFLHTTQLPNAFIPHFINSSHTYHAPKILHLNTLYFRSTPLIPDHRLTTIPVSYTHLRAHETPEHLVCRLLLEK